MQPGRFTSKATLLASIILANGVRVSRSFSILTGTFLVRHVSTTSNPTDTLSKRFMTSSSISTGVKKRVLVPIADDSEEIETTCITDTLTRFGAEVFIASVKTDENLICKMSRGINVVADIMIDEAIDEDWDLIALPGGMPGAEHLRDCSTLISLLRKQKEEGKYYGAICAAPAVVLASKGLIQSGATGYPAPVFIEQIDDYANDDVIVQGNLITSKGPGTALKFSLKLGELLYGEEAARDIAKAMLVDY